MKQLLALFLLLLVFTSCNSEQRLQNAIANIGKEDAFMGSAVGIAGTKPSVYINYERALKLASPDQLSQLINHDQAAVRIYGFQGMVETNHPETFMAFKNLVTDSTSLTTMSGCIMSSERINSLAADLLTSKYSKQEFYQLKGQERIVFDSLLLFSGYLPLGAWTQPLETVAPVDEHYEAVKKLAHDSASITARIGLANFQREADLDFLRSNFDLNDSYDSGHTLEIIFHFPHPSFLPYLKDRQQKLLKSTDYIYDFDDLYLTIFQYPLEDIKPFLEVLDDFPDEVSKKEHQQCAWIAAQLNSNSTKRELVKAIILEEYQSSNLNRLKGLAKYSNLD